MALFQDFIDRYIWSVSKRDYPETLTTVNGTLLQSILGLDDFTEERVTIRQALHITPVYISTMVRGNTIASLPINVIKEEGQKKTQLTDHAAYYLLSQEP